MTTCPSCGAENMVPSLKGEGGVRTPEDLYWSVRRECEGILEGGAIIAERAVHFLRLLTVTQILDVLKQAVPIEQAGIMTPAPDAPPELRPDKIDAHDDYKAALPDVEFVEISRWDFYDEAKKDDVGIVIASGEQRIYANLLLTIGVRQ